MNLYKLVSFKSSLLNFPSVLDANNTYFYSFYWCLFLPFMLSRHPALNMNTNNDSSAPLRIQHLSLSIFVFLTCHLIVSLLFSSPYIGTSLQELGLSYWHTWPLSYLFPALTGLLSYFHRQQLDQSGYFQAYTWSGSKCGILD